MIKRWDGKRLGESSKKPGTVHDPSPTAESVVSSPDLPPSFPQSRFQLVEKSLLKKGPLNPFILPNVKVLLQEGIDTLQDALGLLDDLNMENELEKLFEPTPLELNVSEGQVTRDKGKGKEVRSSKSFLIHLHSH